jgi:hypothetical protein
VASPTPNQNRDRAATRVPGAVQSGQSPSMNHLRESDQAADAHGSFRLGRRRYEMFASVTCQPLSAFLK